MKLHIQTLLLLFFGFISAHVTAQMRIVFNNNPYININSSAYFVIDNPNTNAITSPTVGNIITENEFNVIKWNIGNATGNYIVPFTTSTLVKIPLELNILTAGNTASGSVIFSTYRTPTNTNLPYPSDVTNMNSICNSNNALYAVDRFWRIDAINYSTKPSPVISFVYNNAVTEVGGANTITQSKLQAQRFNAGTNSWETPLKLYGQCNPSLRNVFNSSITPADFFKSWTLIDSTSMLISKSRTVNICSGQSYFLQGSNQTTNGTFYDTLNVFSKCDTSYITNLIVNALPSGITLSANPLITCSNPTPSVMVTSTTSPVSYNWSPATGISSGASTASPSFSLSGTYSVVVTNTLTGCTSTVTTVVSTNTVLPTPSAIANATITCSTTSVSLSSTPTGTNYAYLWAGPGTILNGTTDNPTVVVGGDYTLTITDNVNGCSNTTTVNAPTNTTVPTVTLTPSSVTTTCASPNVTLTTTSSTDPDASYSWTLPATGTLNNTTISNPLAGGYGTFTVQVTNTITGCLSAIQTVSITGDTNIPILNATSAQSVICSSQSTTLSITGADTYSWSTSETASAITVTPANTTTYTVVGTNTLSGCTNTTNITVNVNPTPTVNIAATATTICEGNTTTLILTGATTFTVSNPNQITTGNVVLTPTTQTTYTVIGENQGCASATKTITINVNALPTISLINPQISACENATAQLDVANPGTTYTYSWTNGQNTSTGVSLTVNPLTQATQGNYTVTVIDQNGCQNKTTGNIDVQFCETYVPEFFSPNGDGKNDGFMIKNIENYPNNKLKIFNRWGNLIYQKNNYLNEFEGYANTGDQIGKSKLPSGTYYVILDYGDGQTKTYNGFLVLQY